MPIKCYDKLVNWFIVSTASLDKYNCPTFIMSTSSSGGGIPLGVVITSSESQNILTESFCNLRAVFQQKVFGRGMKTPQMFINDDCNAEKKALRNIWPATDQLLCIFLLPPVLVEVAMGLQTWYC